MQEAVQKKTAAQESLERCLKMQQRPVPSNGNDRVQQLGIQLHTALNHFSSLHLQDGMAAMQVCQSTLPDSLMPSRASIDACIGQ